MVLTSAQCLTINRIFNPPQPPPPSFLGLFELIELIRYSLQMKKKFNVGGGGAEIKMCVHQIGVYLNFIYDVQNKMNPDMIHCLKFLAIS